MKTSANPYLWGPAEAFGEDQLRALNRGDRDWRTGEGETIVDLRIDAMCPVCGEPFTEAGRVEFNHPIEVEDTAKVCFGPDETFSEGVGGITWMYSHTERQV